MLLQVGGGLRRPLLDSMREEGVGQEGNDVRGSWVYDTAASEQGRRSRGNRGLGTSGR